MASNLPPAPIDQQFGAYQWIDWYRKVREAINGAANISWSQITNFTGSNLTSIATRNHNDTQSKQGGSGTEFYHTTAAQNTTIGTLVGSTYTPTRSAEVNMDANVTPTEAQYLRVGTTVTVSGRVTAVNPTLTATATSFELSLPVASNLGAVEDLAGVAFCGAIAGQGAEVIGSVANNTAVIQWIAGDVTSQSWSYTYSYQII